MKIVVVCCTYKRPKSLGQMLYCFQHQDYPNRELVILDDAGQYPPPRGCVIGGQPRVTQCGSGWVLYSTSCRFGTLGNKRNTAIRLAFKRHPGAEAIAVWDDDDWYFPHALDACVAALCRGRWVQPRLVLEVRQGVLCYAETAHRKDPNLPAYHGAWAFRRETIDAVGGYAAVSNGDDQELMRRTVAAVGHSVDLDPGTPPFYVYNRDPKVGHISASPTGERAYRQNAAIDVPVCRDLKPRLLVDYTTWPIDPTPRLRRW